MDIIVKHSNNAGDDTNLALIEFKMDANSFEFYLPHNIIQINALIRAIQYQSDFDWTWNKVDGIGRVYINDNKLKIESEYYGDGFHGGSAYIDLNTVISIVY